MKKLLTSTLLIIKYIYCYSYSIKKSIISNSLIESSITKNLLIVKDAGYKGLGLFCDCQLISKNSYIGEYTGEILTLKDYKRRYINGESQYVFVLSDEDKTQRRDLKYLDAVNIYRSNITRYINHESKNPNLEYRITRRKLQNSTMDYTVKFYSIKDIYYGDELLFDYGPKFQIDYESKLSKKQII